MPPSPSIRIRRYGPNSFGKCEARGFAQDVPRHLRQIAIQQRTAARIFAQHGEHFGEQRVIVTAGGLEKAPRSVSGRSAASRNRP